MDQSDAINHKRLETFVDGAFRRSKGLEPGTAIKLLCANADVVRRHLKALSAWAASQADAPCPPHLEGLSAFDLADAAEALEAEAARRRA